MITIGVHEARSRLSRLLDRVAEGEQIVITRRGRPSARLVSAALVDRRRITDAFESLKSRRQAPTLGSSRWKELRDAGRR